MCAQLRVLLTSALLSVVLLSGPAAVPATDLIGIVRDLYVDPSFTPDALMAGKIAIGGVTSTVERDGYGLPDPEGLGDVLRLGFAKKRKTLGVQPESLTRYLLGEDRYQEIFDVYHEKGKLSRDIVGELGAAFNGLVRYVLFSRVVADYMRENVSESTVTEKVGEKEKEVKYETFTRYRSVTVQFLVYDLEQTQLVWGGAIPRETTTESKYECSNDLGFLGELVFGDDDEERHAKGWPRYPTFEEAVREAFSVFIEVLPEKRES
jgi:hypothetical protein